MILVADSGGSKTHWRWGGGDDDQMQTRGLNPNSTDESQIMSALMQVSQRCAMPERVFFYGAGCGTAASKEWVAAAVAKAFPDAIVSVESDLMGACHAMCDGRAGVVGILGTGSNACLYDGEKIVRRAPSTGYLVGDEGSGYRIGRRLLKDYLANRMPAVLAEAFYAAFPRSRDQWMEAIYSSREPNRLIAAIASFAIDHRDEPYVCDLLQRKFDDYFTEQVEPLCQPELPLYLVGGVAAMFDAEMRQAAARRGMQVNGIMLSPILAMWRRCAKHFMLADNDNK